MGLDDALGPIELRLCQRCNEGVEHSHGSHEADAMAAKLRAEAIASLDDPRVDRAWFFLSFSKPAARSRRRRKRERGTLNLGACYVESPIIAGAAPFAARRLGCNPGGEVMMIGPLPTKEMDEHVPVEYRNRLITSPEEKAVLGIVAHDG